MIYRYASLLAIAIYRIREECAAPFGTLTVLAYRYARLFAIAIFVSGRVCSTF